MLRSFFAVGLAAIGFGVGVGAAPFFEGTWYARGGASQIPLVNGLHFLHHPWQNKEQELESRRDSVASLFVY